MTQTKAMCPVAFDHNSAEHTAAGPLEIYRALRNSEPVAWSDSNGGYWVVTSYAHVSEVLRDADTYTSGAYTLPDGTYDGGIFVPAARGLVPMIPTEVDPPQWEDFRRMLAPRFSPTAVWDYRAMLAELTAHYVDEVIEAGECDLAIDIAAAIPASAILQLLGIDIAEWASYSDPFHNALGYPPDSPEYQAAVAGLQDIADRIRNLIAERRRAPGDDLISHVACAEIEGQPIDDEAAMSVVYTLFSGGVDTTTTLLANIFAYLSRNPVEREYLAADLSRLPLATEEFMRLFTPVQALARTVRKPVTLGGQTLVPGDRVLLAYASANRDEATFPQADECVLGRLPNKHVSWGLGLHRCLGSHLARTQVELILQEVLTRMPDFAIDEQRSRQYPNLGIVNGWVTMPTTFTPGVRRPAGQAFAAAAQT